MLKMKQKLTFLCVEPWKDSVETIKNVNISNKST